MLFFNLSANNKEVFILYYILFIFSELFLTNQIQCILIYLKYIYIEKKIKIK